eukprot:gene29125-35570_t
MRRFGGMISVRLKGGKAAALDLCSRTEIFTLAESLGGVESLIEFPGAMTHASTAGSALEVPDDLVRLNSTSNLQCAFTPHEGVEAHFLEACVNLEQIKAAQQLLAPVMRRTPVVASRVLSETTGFAVSLKCENLQRTGSFKPRGAYNRIANLSAEERAAGVVA